MEQATHGTKSENIRPVFRQTIQIWAAIVATVPVLCPKWVMLFADDGPASMAFRGWWEELRKDTEIMPNLRNVKERQIDYIEVGELYNECRQDLLDSGTHPGCIGSTAAWLFRNGRSHVRRR